MNGSVNTHKNKIIMYHTETRGSNGGPYTLVTFMAFRPFNTGEMVCVQATIHSERIGVRHFKVYPGAHPFTDDHTTIDRGSRYFDHYMREMNFARDRHMGVETKAAA